MKTNIKNARELSGKTQKECADFLNITLRAWQGYEQGIREPKFELLCEIADMFNVTLDYLLGREPAQEPPNPFDALKLTKEQEADANAKYQMLTPQDKAIVASVIQAFAEAHRNEPKPTQMTAVKSVVLYGDSDSDEDSAQTA